MQLRGDVDFWLGLDVMQQLIELRLSRATVGRLLRRFALLAQHSDVVFQTLHDESSLAFCVSQGCDTLSVAHEDKKFRSFFQIMNLERGLVLGVLSFLAGLILLLTAVWQWQAAKFGPLDYSRTMRWVIPGVTLAALGFQTILSSFFVSMLGMKRR